MDELIKSLFAYIQFVVLGAIELALVAYLLAWFHPFRQWLFGYLAELARFWQPEFLRDHSLRLVRVSLATAVLIGALYYLGVVSIASSYWFVEPLRFSILSCIYNVDATTCRGKEHGNSGSEVGALRTIVLPVVGHLSEQPTKANSLYLFDEALIDSQPDSDKKRVYGLLDGELTYSRLLRGTALFSLAAAFFSLFKFLVVLATAFMWKRDDSWYENLVDEDQNLLRRWRSQQSDPDDKRTEQRQRCYIARRYVGYPQILIFALSVTLYVLSIFSYRTTEFEYTRLVRDTACAVKDVALATGIPPRAADGGSTCKR